MAGFPSQAWADRFRVALNDNRDYAEAARAWEGDLLLLVAPDAGSPKGAGVHLDLFHGECRSATYVEDGTSVAPEFVYEGSRADWARLLRGEIDPVASLLNRTFRIRGNLAKAMRFTRAASLLAQTAASVAPRE